jgi:hypothetical protein
MCTLARNSDIRAAVRAARAAAWVASARPSLVQAHVSSRGRVLQQLRRRVQPSQHYNPVQNILAGQTAPPRYLAAPDCVAVPLLALWSAHFRGDHTQVYSVHLGGRHPLPIPYTRDGHDLPILTIGRGPRRWVAIPCACPEVGDGRPSLT